MMMTVTDVSELARVAVGRAQEFIDTDPRVLLARKRTADVLVRVAYRLDPYRARVTDAPAGGYNIMMGNVPLARIDSGMIRNERIVQR